MSNGNLQPQQLSGTRFVAALINQMGSLAGKSVFQDSAGQSVLLDGSEQSVFIGSDGKSLTNVLEEIYQELVTMNSTLLAMTAQIATCCHAATTALQDGVDIFRDVLGAAGVEKLPPPPPPTP
jgi:hypothetical protein